MSTEKKPTNTGGRPPKFESPVPFKKPISDTTLSAELTLLQEELHELVKLAGELRLRLQNKMKTRKTVAPRDVTMLGQIGRTVGQLLKEVRQVELLYRDIDLSDEDCIRILIKAGWKPPGGKNGKPDSVDGDSAVPKE